MGDYWSLTDMYNREKKDTKEKKGKKKDKDKKKGKPLFEETKEKKDKGKKSTMQYGELLKSNKTGIFEAKIIVKGDKKKVYIYRTENMRYPNVFMDLQNQSFKDWVIDQIDNDKINPNRTMYGAEITDLNIPEKLFGILKDANIICEAYARKTGEYPVEDDDEDEKVCKKADKIIEKIQDEH